MSVPDQCQVMVKNLPCVEKENGLLFRLSPNQKWFTAFASTCLLFSAISCVRTKQNDKPAPLPTPKLTAKQNTKKGQVYRVPLISHDGWTFIFAEIEGKRIIAMLDTGMSSASLPSYFDPYLKHTGAQEYFSFWSERKRFEVLQIHRVGIGKYSTNNIKTIIIPSHFSMPPADSLILRVGGDTALSTPILGLSIIDNHQITLDARNNELLIYERRHDLTQQLRSRDVLLRLHYDDNNGVVPFIEGEVEGRSTRFMLDTGLGWKNIIINTRLRSRLSSRFGTSPKHGARNFQNDNERLAHVRWSLGGSEDDYGITAETEAHVIAEDPVYAERNDIGAYVGSWLLERYRVTIDRKERLLLLEPYPVQHSTPPFAVTRKVKPLRTRYAKSPRVKMKDTTLQRKHGRARQQ